MNVVKGRECYEREERTECVVCNERKECVSRHGWVLGWGEKRSCRQESWSLFINTHTPLNTTH